MTTIHLHTAQEKMVSSLVSAFEEVKKARGFPFWITPKELRTGYMLNGIAPVAEFHQGNIGQRLLGLVREVVTVRGHTWYVLWDARRSMWYLEG